jgi:serpin B
MNRLAVGLVALTACSTSPSTDPTEIKSDLARDQNPNVSATDLATTVAGNTEFAARLYGFASQTSSDNLFMSPHSISTALAMTYAGAAGTTATQMADALRFTQPPAALHASLNALDLELASRAQAGESDAIPFRLRTANSIWGQTGFGFQAPFLDTLAINYGAGLNVLDFASDPDGSRETINAWVEDRTNDKIVDLLPDGVIQQSTKLVLTNAIYFSAAWSNPFETSDTQDRPFQVAGSPVQVPTLYQSASLRYSETAAFKAVELPYDGEQLSMVVVVPTGALSSFEQQLTAATFAEVTYAMSTRAVDLYLPKFRFDAPLEVKPILQELGMTDAFTDGAADFSPIDGTRDLVITDVLHKGFVAIDERGTEAAAATAVIVGPTSIPEPATMLVDRPFLFFIRDIPTDAILFVGRVVDPR